MSLEYPYPKTKSNKGLLLISPAMFIETDTTGILYLSMKSDLRSAFSSLDLRSSASSTFLISYIVLKTYFIIPAIGSFTLSKDFSFSREFSPTQPTIK